MSREPGEPPHEDEEADADEDRGPEYFVEDEEHLEFRSGLLAWDMFVSHLAWFASQTGLEMTYERRRRGITMHLDVHVRGRRGAIGEFAEYAQELARKSRPKLGGVDKP